MKLRKLMTRDVQTIAPSDTIAEAARRMAEFDVGALPVVENGKIEGILTDRDISVRAVAADKDRMTSVSEIMSRNVVTCNETDHLDEVLEIMSDQQIRRIPVCSNQGQLVGILTVGDAARDDYDAEDVAETLRDICRPHGLHSQSLAAA